MARLIIAGIGQGAATMHKTYSLDIPGWEVTFCHSMKFKTDLVTCWKDVMRHANELRHGGAHIFAFHNVHSMRKDFESHVYARHRMVWLDPNLIRDYGTSLFTDAVRRLVEFEELWRNIVRPRDTRSPLVLPEAVFEASPRVRHVWRLAQKVQHDDDRTAEVTQLLQSFRQEHYLKRYWRDANARRFDPGGARHGGHIPSERCWKYCFEIPPGFHFDVSAELGGHISIRDAEGRVHEYTNYANVDCHGYVRSGK